MQAEGHVLQLIEHPNRWHLQLESGTNLFWLELPRRPSDDFSGLVGATVRAPGVCKKESFEGGETLRPTLMVQDATDIEILHPSRANISIEPENTPVQPIASLTRELAASSNAQVHVRGTVLDQRLGESIVLRDDTGTISAEASQRVAMDAGHRIDLWGTLAWDGSRLHLASATFRALDAGRPPPDTATTATDKPAELPLLTKVLQIRSLSAAQAAWQYPVQFRGVVTLYLPQQGAKFYVQDDTSGIYIRPKPNTPELKPGDLVEITGLTDPGGFAPIVVPTRVAVLGTAPFPEAARATPYQLASGQYNCQWMEAHGVIRAVTYENGLVQLKLDDPSGTFFINIPASSEPTNLLDSVVRVDGVCSTTFNSKRQITGSAIWAQTLDLVQIEEPAVGDPLDLPEQPILSLSQFHPLGVLQRRVRVSGVATLCQPGQSFFIQDDSDAIEVLASQKGHIAPGDHVVVAGYPSLGDFGTVLRDAVFRVQGHGAIPQPKSIAAGHTLDPDLDDTWVQVDARLLNSSVVGDVQVLTLQIPGSIFEAHCPRPEQDAGALRSGSLLRLTGVYRVLADEARLPNSFQMLLPSAANIEVLERPSWWTIRHSLTVVGALAMLVAATTLWIAMLRRKVSEQTASLQQSEIKFRSLVEKSLVGVYVIQDGRFAYLNPRLAEIYGHTPEEMIGSLTVRDTVFAEDWPQVEEQIRRRISGEVTTVHYGFRIRRKDGSLAHVEVLGSRSEYQGKPAVVGTLMDVTDRKQAEEALRFTQFAVDHTADAAFWIKPDGRFFYVNDAACRALGYSREELLSLGVADIDPHFLERVWPDFWTNLKQSGTMTFEALHKARGGRTFPVEIRANFVEFEGNEYDCAFARDITERKRAEAALAEASGLLETLLANSPDCIYFKDRESRFIRYSKAFAKLFHLADSESLRGKTDFDFFSEKHARPAYEDEQEIIRTGQPLIGKLEKETHPDSHVTWALTTKMPWRDHNGDIIGTFGISKDVTAIKEAEDKLAYERELFQTLLRTIPDHIYFKDRESRFVQVSKSKAEGTLQTVLDNSYDARPSEVPGKLPSHLASGQAFAEWMIGKTDFDTYPENHARASFEHEQEIIRSGLPMVGKLERAALSGGRFIWYLTTKMPWRDKEGNIIGTFGVSKDVTVVKEAEDKLAHERELFRDAAGQHSRRDLFQGPSSPASCG